MLLGYFVKEKVRLFAAEESECTFGAAQSVAAAVVELAVEQEQEKEKGMEKVKVKEMEMEEGEL